MIFTRSSYSRKCEILWYLWSANSCCGGCGNKKLAEAQPLFHGATGWPHFGQHAAWHKVCLLPSCCLTPTNPLLSAVTGNSSSLTRNGSPVILSQSTDYCQMGVTDRTTPNRQCRRSNSKTEHNFITAKIMKHSTLVLSQRERFVWAQVVKRHANPWSCVICEDCRDWEGFSLLMERLHWEPTSHVLGNVSIFNLKARSPCQRPRFTSFRAR
jgi:hypothetical protein